VELWRDSAVFAVFVKLVCNVMTIKGLKQAVTLAYVEE
jgi:hypothetical protein